MSYIVKAEINGIQDFIFNIQSKGAAKALKARSFMVDAACILIKEIFRETFPRLQLVFNGGGNIYLEIENSAWKEGEFTETAQKIANQLLSYQMTISLAFEHYDENTSFGKFIEKLNEKLNREKLRFGVTHPFIFAPHKDNYKSQTDFIGFTKTYSKSDSIEISDSAGAPEKVITEKYIQVLNKRLTLANKKNHTLIPLPVWTKPLLKKYKPQLDKLKSEDPAYNAPDPGDIINFEELAVFAKERTGTDNIGVLKLDVDNLGRLFQQLNEKETNKQLSFSLRTFFSQTITKLLGTARGDYSFGDNIYTVYAGGDDCLFIGAWDATTEFAMLLQKEFSSFEKRLRDSMAIFKNPITISASLLIVDPHFPVVRFAEIAEENLKKAKDRRQDQPDASGEKMKNNIAFMNHVFSWDEFYELVGVKNTLDAMIREHNESRAFLHRIIHSFENSDTIYWHKCKPSKPFNPAILWRFLYSFRDIIQKKYFKDKFYPIFFSRTDGYYNKHVWKQFRSGKELSQVMPVAARWTELLNRNKHG